MADLLEALGERVLLCDGAMGSRVQALDLDVDRDFLGHENCTDILTRSRPDLIRQIHRDYLAAGADIATTNTFGASPLTLGEFGLGEVAFALNKEAAELAAEAVEDFRGDGRQRFVLGDVGPGTKLPSLGHIGYDALEDAFAVQCAGLIAGGVDAVVVETCQDPLQIKAAVNGARRARRDAAADTPILVQVTVETTGTLLVGTDIAAAATVVHSLGVPLLGINCATGPQEMAEHVRWLGDNWPGPISVQPNAGLPELVDGRTRYPLGPGELAQWLERFVAEDGINMIGGCCGTDVAHITALDAMLRRRAANGAARPAPPPRRAEWTPSAASLYGQTPLRQENAFLSIGERCNANGSKKFRQLLQAGDWEGCVAMARDQVGEGSHAIDVCAAFVGRDERADMTELVSRLRGAVTAPLVIDSTDPAVIETALKLYGGKAILNSINFEDGEEPARRMLELARRFGAGVIALTIDEDGMAKGAGEKVAIARRLHDFACRRHGLPDGDLLIDPLTFTICTGNDDDRRLALNTLEAIAGIRAELAQCQVVLGVSNVSFGLEPAARHMLNSVFLDHALRRGMTGAIVHVSRIMPLHRIPDDELAIVEDLIFDRRRDGYDPLYALIDLFADRDAATAGAEEPPATVEDRLRKRIVEGDRQGLEADIDQALETHSPLDIINTLLLDGMKTVGELFGSGRMQLPFVLQSAETMKAAVGHLEPLIDKAGGLTKGTVVLATVKGDVHDIGKNLVDIILTNNGYRVINLGIKQPIADIVAAAREHDADAVGMSGLLVKSAVVMRDNLAEMARLGIEVPVLLGGAALTRKYVEEDCAGAYPKGRVSYARDAFEGLRLIEEALSEGGGGPVAESRRTPAKAPPPAEPRPVDWERVRLLRSQLHADVAVPEPPFLGARLIEDVPVRALVPLLNRNMLFRFHWGFRKDGRDRAQWREWAESEVRPILERMLAVCEEQDILHPAAAYGYWRCASEGDAVVLFDGDGEDQAARFAFPRQRRRDGLCIADFFRDIDGEARDVIALQVVTVGRRASEVAGRWFAEDRYRDYLYLHGLGVEMTEALAEYVHQRIRDELGFGHRDDRKMDRLLRQGYRGARYSFGYPACPELDDQRRLLELLGAERIGVAMADEGQLHPEQSTSAIVVHHPQARYFTV